VKLYQRGDVNETLSSTLEIVLRQVRVLIPQSKILQREYRKRELVREPLTHDSGAHISPPE